MRQDTGAARVPQHNADAERALLAAMILSPGTATDILAAVPQADFFLPSHRKMFAALAELDAEGGRIDHIALADKLASKRDPGSERTWLDDVGGKVYIIDVAQLGVYAMGNWEKHAEIVRDAALMRGLTEAGTRIAAIGFDPPEDAAAAVEEAEKALFDVTDRRVVKEFADMGDLLAEAYAGVAELQKSGRDFTGVRTGFSDLDTLFGGLRGGDLVVLAARPSVGKTAFALNLGVRAAKSGTRVCLFSLEMSSAQLVQRVVSTEAKIPSKSLQTGRFGAGEWDRFAKCSNALSALPLSIDDTAAIGISEMRAKARRRLHGCGEGEGLVIVDYLQLMKPRDKRGYANREAEVAEISRGLKVLAKELGVPIVALSQLNRGVEARADKRPLLSDLRESGAIEQDADIVMFLDRSKTRAEAEGPGNRPPMGTAKVIVAKHRNGPIGEVSLAFDERFTYFSDLARVG